MATNLSWNLYTVKSLGKVATGSKFTCGGTLHTPSKVQLNYLNKTGQWSGATLPGLDFQEIVESSIVASAAVTDKSYRAVDPENFTTSFQLSDSDILGEVRLLLVPDVLNIRAELYKMNIYTAPTGCFKAHVDTPRGGNMFGSLVVCLPSQFTGGALVTRHNGQQVTYDWSSPADNPVQNIRWAAFYSDVEHEILPVTEGHHVTLTYNLYHCDQISPVPTVDITTSPLYSNLKAALDHPHFLRDGGVLGFACHHAYIFEKFNKSKNLSLVLKGSDRTVLLAAKSLGLKVNVKPIVMDSDNESDDDDEPEDARTRYYIRHSFSYTDAEFEEDWEWTDYFGDGGCGVENGSHINWCQTLDDCYRGPAISAMLWDAYNPPRVDTCFQMPAILVTIPRWSKRHHTGEQSTIKKRKT